MSKSLFSVIFVFLFLCGLSFADEVTPDGVKKEFYPDGKIKVESFYKKDVFYSNFYFENGRLGESREMEMKTGLQHTKNFYLDGKLLAETTFQNDLLKIKKYSPDGRLQLDGVYKTSKTGGMPMEDVDVKMYDEQGNILVNGIYKEYNLDGTLRSETVYKDGKAAGPGKEYDEKGNLITK